VGGMENSFSPGKRKDVDVSQGPPEKRKGDVMQIHGVINTPPVLGENAPSTSRQGTHVESAKVDMALLEEEQARELFMFHAFKHANHVSNDFKNISMEIIKACKGLPLSLEILGCYLHGICDLEIWKDALRELKVAQNMLGGFDNEFLWKTLKISYDHLNEEHQNMFLDIACFFVGFKKKTFCRVYWNADDSSSPMLGLQNLTDRSFIKWAEDGSLYIHEQLRDMGRNIAMKVTMSRFIWKPNIYLQKNQV
jgi:hypothetical protein